MAELLINNKIEREIREDGENKMKTSNKSNNRGPISIKFNINNIR